VIPQTYIFFNEMSGITVGNFNVVESFLAAMKDKSDVKVIALCLLLHSWKTFSLQQ
jgi:hypothetical protein